MASVREITTKAGVTSYRVLFRHGQKQTSMTFGDPETAERFRTLVDPLGPDRALRAPSEEAGGTDDRLTVDDLAGRFLASRPASPWSRSSRSTSPSTSSRRPR